MKYVMDKTLPEIVDTLKEDAISLALRCDSEVTEEYLQRIEEVKEVVQAYENSIQNKEIEEALVTLKINLDDINTIAQYPFANHNINTLNKTLTSVQEALEKYKFIKSTLTNQAQMIEKAQIKLNHIQEVVEALFPNYDIDNYTNDQGFVMRLHDLLVKYPLNVSNSILERVNKE